MSPLRNRTGYMRSSATLPPPPKGCLQVEKVASSASKIARTEVLRFIGSKALVPPSPHESAAALDRALVRLRCALADGGSVEVAQAFDRVVVHALLGRIAAVS